MTSISLSSNLEARMNSVTGEGGSTLGKCSCGATVVELYMRNVQPCVLFSHSIHSLVRTREYTVVDSIYGSLTCSTNGPLGTTWMRNHDCQRMRNSGTVCCDWKSNNFIKSHGLMMAQVFCTEFTQTIVMTNLMNLQTQSNHNVLECRSI